MQTDSNTAGQRILVVDDNETIHGDIRKILCPTSPHPDLLNAETLLFGRVPFVEPVPQGCFQIDSAYQGREGLKRVEEALATGAPYAMAFVDVRMPPGWDGIETIRKLWERQPDLQVVICTAYSDHSWEDIIRSLGQSDNFVILKKPFDNIEVLQLAHALTRKWLMTGQAQARMSGLKEMVAAQTAKLTKTNEELRAENRRREQIEIELRGSEHRFEMAFKASTIPMAIMHAATRTHLEVNLSYTALMGMPREEILGRSPTELGLLVRPEDCDQAIEMLNHKERLRDVPVRIRPRGAEPREVLVSIEPVILGEDRCLLIAMMDVTEQRKLETQLRQSQKMEAIGQLAAGVAHDFNNLLTIIHGHASLQAGRPSHDEQTVHSLTQIKMAADRAASLTRQLLAFSRKQVMQPRPICLNDIIDRSQKMLARLLGETIQLDCACAAGLPRVFADENSMDQVLMNLAVNARDAMPQGGRLRIATEEVTLGTVNWRRNPDARPGRFVRLTVTDNGCGMDTTVITRIFEPFFTTKAPGKGTGLGLSTVYGIVQQHEGWVEVESRPGIGTTFHIFLPVTDKPPVKTDDTSFILAQEKPAKQRETILVVEDETVLREFITSSLQSQGYVVLEAADGMAALKEYRDETVKIDLLLTDMVMPNGVSGAVLAAQLSSRRKDMKVLFTSGYSQELMENSSRLVVGVNFLPKPFDLGRLLKTVRACLESPPVSGVTTTGLVGVKT
jgi:PAS domain S-box-containing protein